MTKRMRAQLPRITLLRWALISACLWAGHATACDRDTVWLRTLVGPGINPGQVNRIAHDATTGRTVAVGSVEGQYAAACFDTLGNLLWLVKFDPGAWGGQAAKAAFSPDQSVAVVGRVDNDILVARIDPNGDTLWTRRIYQADGFYGYDIAADVDGSIYVHAATGIYNQQLVTMRFDSGGELRWTREYGSFQCWPGALALDGKGHVIVTGGTPAPQVHVIDCVTLKYDTTGNLLWDRLSNGFDKYPYSFGAGIVADDSGNIYTASQCNSSGDSLDNYDYAIASYRPNGDLRWARTYGLPGVGNEQATGIALVPGGSAVRLTGYAGTLTYDSSGTLLSVWPQGGNSMSISDDGRVALVDDDMTATLLDGNGDVLWMRECPSTYFAANVDFTVNGDVLTAALAQLDEPGTFDWLIVRYNPCICGPQCDLDSGGTIDAIDLALVIDIVFFGSPDVHDAECTITRSDFNANGLIDAVDIALLIDHVFFGGTAPTNPCAT